VVQLQFYINVKGDRANALERRDQIISAMKPLGFGVVMIDSDLVVFMSNAD
jgi:hypothetical protein